MNTTRSHYAPFLDVAFLALVFLPLSFIPVVQADDNYMGEMSVAWDRYDDGDHESDTYRVDAQIHFSVVDIGEFPRKEAAFLNRIGSVTVSGYENRYGLTGIGYGDSEGEGQGQFLSVVAMKPGFPVMLHAAGGSSEDERRDVYVFGPIDWTTATEEYKVELGIFPAKSLLVKAGHYKSEGTTETSWLPGSSWDSSTEGNSLSLKYVGRPGSQYVNLEAFYEASKHEFSTIKYRTKALGALGEYYLTQDLGLGAGYVVVESDLDGDVDEFNVLSLNGTYFIFPSLSVTMQYNRVDNDDSVKNYSIKVATRF